MYNLDKSLNKFHRLKSLNENFLKFLFHFIFLHCVDFSKTNSNFYVHTSSSLLFLNSKNSVNGLYLFICFLNGSYLMPTNSKKILLCITLYFFTSLKTFFFHLVFFSLFTLIFFFFVSIKLCSIRIFN